MKVWADFSARTSVVGSNPLVGFGVAMIIACATFAAET
jgi:hypothetical protein